MHTANCELRDAQQDNRATVSHRPLAQVRPGARLLDTEAKLITHAVLMAAYNAETTLARALADHYSRADDEARALIRDTFTLSGDLNVLDGELRITLDPASAPRRTRALAALCQQLTTAAATYPGTNLKISYAMKPHPTAS